MSVQRLSRAAQSALSTRALAPGYDARDCKTGIVHLGLGGFHRAHQAAYIDAALEAGERQWAISGWSLRRGDMHAALAPQDGLYTLITRDSQSSTARIMGPIREVGFAPGTPEALLSRIASPDTRIVSLTITEKGYALAADGGLDTSETDVAADLAGAWPPRSALGWLAAGLCARRERAPEAALTLLSCDNLSGNGDALARVLDEFLRRSDRVAVADWLRSVASCPNCMVDRIVPATTADDRALAASLIGLRDEWPVTTEPFRQWVIEDRFAGGRPQLEAHGVQFSNSVRDWEDMKLRLLNAAHSSIAYLGLLAGITTVADAIREPLIAGFVENLWRQEAIATLPNTMQTLAPTYCAQLRSRFANRALAHRTLQIASDGSKKIPVRWLPTIAKRLAAGQRADALSLALAAWIQCLAGTDDQGGRIALDDPLAGRLAPLARREESALAVRSVLQSVPALEPLSSSTAFTDKVADALAGLREQGALASLSRLLAVS